MNMTSGAGNGPGRTYKYYTGKCFSCRPYGEKYTFCFNHGYCWRLYVALRSSQATRRLHLLVLVYHMSVTASARARQQQDCCEITFSECNVEDDLVWQNDQVCFHNTILRLQTIITRLKMLMTAKPHVNISPHATFSFLTMELANYTGRHCLKKDILMFFIT